MMEYKGYRAQIDFDEEAGLFHGEVISSRIGICFSGRSVDELTQAFHGAVDEYLSLCAGRGQAPDEPFCGRFAIRVAPDVHKTIALAAHREGKPLHTWITERLVEAAQGHRLI